jgi:RTA1 like protein
MRIIFRLCEYAQGFQSNIPTHEAYQYCLDSVPMLFALVILNILHPGRIMPGEESNLPSRKERKLEGIHNKSQKVSRSSRLTV